MSGQFSGLERAVRVKELQRELLDVLVIGGGITGSGIALDAAMRGMKVGVVEMQDFAAGTSSRSTKLVHGGLRYLKQLQIGLVAEVGRERAIVHENGPHVTTPERMLLPFHEGGTFGTWSTSLGLKVYDFLAGVKRGERRVMLSAEQTLAKEPLLRRPGLKGGGYYMEYRTDDARLTIEVLKAAVSRGAKAVNYVKASELLYRNGKAAGARLTDRIGGKQFEVYARCVVNASGPWVDEVRELDRSRRGKVLQLTKGVHLVFDGKRFPLRQAVYFDTPDRRMVFAIPREGKTYVGTTDTVYNGELAHPRMTASDRDYLLDAVHHMFPGLNLSAADVESSWAGVRPLIYEEGKNPSEISRKDEIWVSGSGLITIAGGKLTGYRKMAQLVVDKVAEALQRQGRGTYPQSRTAAVPVSGGDVGGSAGFARFVEARTAEGVKLGLPPELARAWVSKYGSNTDRLFGLFRAYGGSPEAALLPPEAGVPLQYALMEEMAVKPVDFFIRRTGAIFFDRAWAERWKKPVTEAMAARLAWTPEQRESYLDELEAELLRAVVPAEEE